MPSQASGAENQNIRPIFCCGSAASANQPASQQASQPAIQPASRQRASQPTNQPTGRQPDSFMVRIPWANPSRTSPPTRISPNFYARGPKTYAESMRGFMGRIPWVHPSARSHPARMSPNFYARGPQFYAESMRGFISRTPRWLQTYQEHKISSEQSTTELPESITIFLCAVYARPITLHRKHQT